MDFTRMNLTAFTHKLQQRRSFLPLPLFPWSYPWMHQRLQRSRDESVINENIFIDIQGCVAAFKIPSPIVRDAMPKDEILGAGRRPDRIGLHKTHLLERASESGGLRETPRDGESSKIV